MTHTLIAWLLDESGSMQPKADDVRGGYANFVRDQQSQPGELEVSVYRFSNAGTLTNGGIWQGERVPLTLAYSPMGGTALIQSACEAIDDLGAKLAARLPQARPDKVIFITMTDGEENASKRYTKEDLRQRIAHQENAYGWQFVWMVADVASFDEAIASYGARQGSTILYQNSTTGTQSTMGSASASVSSFRAGLTSSPEFTNQQREDSAAGKVA